MSLSNVDIDRDFPLFAKSKDAWSILDFPNGRSTPVHDTWASQRGSRARTHTVSTIAPGFGQADMGLARPA